MVGCGLGEDAAFLSNMGWEMLSIFPNQLLIGQNCIETFLLSG